jgi:hypothetical protein
MTYLYASLKDFQATEQTFSAHNMKFIIFFNFTGYVPFSNLPLPFILVPFSLSFTVNVVFLTQTFSSIKIRIRIQKNHSWSWQLQIR